MQRTTPQNGLLYFGNLRQGILNHDTLGNDLPAMACSLVGLSGSRSSWTVSIPASTHAVSVAEAGAEGGDDPPEEIGDPDIEMDDALPEEQMDPRAEKAAKRSDVPQDSKGE